MFSNLLGKNKEEAGSDKEHLALVEKISKMNLTDMRVYVNNKLTSFEVSEDGLSEVMSKLISKDSNEKRFIESDTMDSKIKKAFDLVILISTNKNVNQVTLELIQEFIILYKDIITKYDTDNKQIYNDKLKNALANCLATVQTLTGMNRKMGVLGE